MSRRARRAASGGGRAVRLLASAPPAARCAGCSAEPVPRRDWSSFDGEGAATLRRPSPPMPDEPDPRRRAWPP